MTLTLWVDSWRLGINYKVPGTKCPQEILGDIPYLVREARPAGINSENAPVIDPTARICVRAHTYVTHSGGSTHELFIYIGAEGLSLALLHAVKVSNVGL